jgi:hypothetical protein
VAGRIDAGVGDAAGWSLAPDLWLQRGRARIELTGETRDFGASARGLAGLLAGSWFQPVRGPVGVELAGTVQAQGGAGLADAGAWYAGPRLHLMGGNRGLWLGIAAGQDDLGSTRRWEAALWQHLGRFSLQVQGWQTATTLRQSAGPDTAAPFPDTLAAPRDREIRTTTDLGVWLRYGGGRTEALLASGMRFGVSQPGLQVNQTAQDPSSQGRRQTVSSTWWMAEATWWLMDRVGLVGTVGRQPVDPSYAAAGEAFLRLGFRASLQGRRNELRPAPASRTRPGLAAERVGSELVELRLVATGAQRVELMADFTDWSPISLERRGGVWRVQLPIAPGIHRVNVRYDGGPWGAPPATRIVWDEFGSESGELLIN